MHHQFGEMMRSPKRPEKSDEGVSATIGTIMALMVFMFLFGMIQTQYVPVAMKDTEANHMHDLESQFGTIKEKIDNIIMMNSYNYTVYAPITLGSDGIPVFAQPTPGFMRFSPSKEQIHIKYVATENISGNSSTTVMYGNSSGYVSVYLPNRYYTQEGYAYSCGSVILYQPSGSVMVANPTFSIINKSGDISASFNMIRLIGENSTLSGTSTVGTHSSLIYTYKDSHTISNISHFVNSTLWVNLSTAYPDAWVNWFKTSLENGGLHNYTKEHGGDFNITVTPENSTVYPSIYSVSIKINNVKMFSLEKSLVEMKIGET